MYKEFKVSIRMMLHQIQNKSNKEVEHIKRKKENQIEILQLKFMINEMENSLEFLNSRIEQVEERIYETEGILIKIFQSDG